MTSVWRFMAETNAQNMKQSVWIKQMYESVSDWFLYHATVASNTSRIVWKMYCQISLCSVPNFCLAPTVPVPATCCAGPWGSGRVGPLLGLHQESTACDVAKVQRHNGDGGDVGGATTGERRRIPQHERLLPDVCWQEQRTALGRWVVLVTVAFSPFRLYTT